jgi:hypothetical protein
MSLDLNYISIKKNVDKYFRLWNCSCNTCRCIPFGEDFWIFGEAET